VRAALTISGSRSDLSDIGPPECRHRLMVDHFMVY
jgi:hypothetical protein